MTHHRQAVLVVAALLGFASVGHAQRRTMSGDLTKALASYTGDEFFNLTNGLQFGPDSTKPRRCRGSQACNNGTGRDNVSIAEVQDADSVSAGTVSPFGTIVARALNRGNDTTTMYNMKPQGRYRYYLIVTPQSTWILEELDMGAGRSHQTVASGRFTPCPNHAFQRGARADFRTCAQAQGDMNHATASLRSFNSQMLAGSKRAVPSFGSLLAYLRQGTGEPPIWIGCAVGCCTADQ